MHIVWQSKYHILPKDEIKYEKIYSTYDTKAFIVLHILKVIYYTILGVYLNTLIALYNLYSLKGARSS